MRISFKDWLLQETKDIFGFNNLLTTDDRNLISNDSPPIQPISIELVMNELSRFKLNETIPFSNFLNHIQWGRHNGSTQMVISPLGSFKSIIRRQQSNLLGEQVWICKRVLPYKDIMEADLKIDENLAHMLFEEIQKISDNQLESAIGDYKNLEGLVTKLSQDVQRQNVIPSSFIFMGTKEIKHNEHYIIHFELKGQGVEAPSSNRVEMFAIEMSYKPSTGIIRSFGHDVQSPTKGHLWYPQPSEWDECFSPAQSIKEINNCICSALSTY
jgi:hypothetical protein